jgi:hypothetical protein
MIGASKIAAISAVRWRMYLSKNALALAAL